MKNCLLLQQKLQFNYKGLSYLTTINKKKMNKHFSYNQYGRGNKVEACPVSYQQVNKNLIKSYSSIVLIVLAYTLISGHYWAMYLISLDFLIRVFAGIKYSPLCNFLTAMMKITPLKPVLVNAASKKIAAQVGLVFAVGVCLFHLLGYELISHIFIYMFMFAISLDLVFNYCLACKLQSLYLTYFSKR